MDKIEKSFDFQNLLSNIKSGKKTWKCWKYVDIISEFYRSEKNMKNFKKKIKLVNITVTKNRFPILSIILWSIDNKGWGHLKRQKLPLSKNFFYDEEKLPKGLKWRDAWKTTRKVFTWWMRGSDRCWKLAGEFLSNPSIEWIAWDAFSFGLHGKSVAVVALLYSVGFERNSHPIRFNSTSMEAFNNVPRDP